jgi:hypothetical protein
MHAHGCNICRERSNILEGYALSRGNIPPTYRLCARCGNLLDLLIQKLETLAAVEHRLGLDRVIAA